tara:strand:+ start:360 stop:1373 length:1014 start_codon:yes stop_codon:yes gene_type:complete
MQNLDENIDLKDILIKISEYKNHLLLNKKSIFKGIIVFIILGISGSFLLPNNYNAKLTFVVEASSSNILSSYSGIASQFGIDLGMSESSTFTQNNIIEIIKSRSVIEASLMTKSVVNNSRNLLVEHYLTINEYVNDLDVFQESSPLERDSIIAFIWQDIVENSLAIDFESRDATIITITFSSVDEEFSKIFTETLIQEIEKLYTSITVNKARNTVQYVQKRADSVFTELKTAEQEYARVKDINERIVKASGRLKELQLMRDVEVLNTIYLELIKNIEISKITLLNTTPIIQIIDKPKFPLENDKVSLLVIIFISGIIGFFFAVSRLIFLKGINDVLN